MNVLIGKVDYRGNPVHICEPCAEVARSIGLKTRPLKEALIGFFEHLADEPSQTEPVRGEQRRHPHQRDNRRERERQEQARRAEGMGAGGGEELAPRPHNDGSRGGYGALTSRETSVGAAFEKAADRAATENPSSGTADVPVTSEDGTQHTPQE